VGRILGIEIRLDLSVILIFALVVFTLGRNVLPDWHPGWGFGLVWGTAVIAGILLFLSILAHELSHSVVARLRGIPVPRITLFVFGGVSEMAREPDTPRTELLVAVVGPLTSIVLGIAFTFLGVALAGRGPEGFSASAVESALAGMGPVPTLLLWLGPINLMLGVFNLVPGFPLDGGRVLRSILWMSTGNLERATRWASGAGRAVGWLLMGWGVVQLLGGEFIQGLWLLLIGWFLGNAARSQYSQLLIRQALEGLRVRDLMRTQFETVEPDADLSAFLEGRLLRGAQPVWPVVRGGTLLGMISLESIRSAEPGAGAPVSAAMVPVPDTVDPDLGGSEALRRVVGAQQDPLPVVERGKLVGLLHRSDLMRWLAMHELRSRGE